MTSKDKNLDWLCPLCSKRRMPYGTSCVDYKEGACPNQNDLNVNGQWYANQDKKADDSKAIGIAAISDEV